MLCNYDELLQGEACTPTPKISPRSPHKGLPWWLSHSDSLPRICLQCRIPWFNPWGGKIPWRRDRLPTTVFSGFPCGSAGKESACNARDLGSIPGLGRSPGEGKGYPLQYSGLEKSLHCIAHGVTKSHSLHTTTK